MKKVLVLMVLCLFVATSAFAQGLAVGWESGVSAKLPLGAFSVQGVLGFSSSSPEDDTLDSTTSFSIAGYGAMPIIDMGDAALNVFGGVGFHTCTDDDLDIAIRGGLQHDVMVNDYVSVSGKAGLEVWLDGGITDVDDTGSTDIGTWGTVGIYWHFQ